MEFFPYQCQAKFRRVFYVPGNHELWLSPSEAAIWGIVKVDPTWGLKTTNSAKVPRKKTFGQDVDSRM